MADINTDEPSDEATQEELDAYHFTEYLDEKAQEFDDLCNERHRAGQKEYGAITFLENDVVRMMLEELADTSNYCRMQGIKLLMLQEQLENDPRIAGFATESEGGDIQIGAQAFQGTKKGWGPK